MKYTIKNPLVLEYGKQVSGEVKCREELISKEVAEYLLEALKSMCETGRSFGWDSFWVDDKRRICYDNAIEAIKNATT